MQRLPWNDGGVQRFVLVPDTDAEKSEMTQSLESLGVFNGMDFVGDGIIGRLAFPVELNWASDGALPVTVTVDQDASRPVWFWLVEHGAPSPARFAWWGSNRDRERAVPWEPVGSVEPDESTATKLIKWILDQGIAGVPPLSSAEHLAQEYKIDQSYANDDERVDSLINWETSKNFTSGFITGLGGVIVMPVSMSAALGASWLIQARMAGAIARLYGHSLQEDRVRTLMLLSLAGDSAKEVLKRFGIVFGQKLSEQVIRQIPGRLLIEINKGIGFRLLAKSGEKSLVVLSKLVPVVGGFVGGTFDAVACRAVGRVAKDLFRAPDPAEPYENGA
jgi:hypothetical protein